MTDQEFINMELKSNKPEKDFTLVGFLLFFLVATLLIIFALHIDKKLPEPKTIIANASDPIKEQAIIKYQQKNNLPKKKNIYDYWIENPNMLKSNYEYDWAYDPAGNLYVNQDQFVRSKEWGK